MVKMKLYVSILIVLMSTMIGVDILMDNHKNIEPDKIAGAIAYVDDTTTTSTTTTTQEPTTTTSKQIVTTSPVKELSNNTMTISGYDRIYYLKQDDGRRKILEGNQYAMVDHRYTSDSKKLIIYAHSSPDGKGLFQYFQNYDGDRSFYEKHKYLTVNYDNIVYTYEIFSVYNQRITDDRESTEYYMTYEYPDAYLYNKALQSYKSKSQYPIDIKLNADDKILIIQTCSMNPNRVGRTNLLVFAKLINKKEA